MAAASRARVGLEAAAVTAVFGLTYAAGACPSIYVGDSGELVAAVATLGIPHPSGYPLYVLAGKLWSMLVPVGSVAWRMSLFSAACAAATCGLLYGFVRPRIGAQGALLSVALAGLGPSFWSQANIQRVYALNALFVVAVVVAAARWRRTGRDRSLAAAFFLAGLGATNHTFMAVEAVVLALWALACEPHWLKRPAELVGRALVCAAAFAVGLLPYAYLPLRSAMNPRLDWGNPETLSNLWAVVSRRDFWDRAWIETPWDLVTIAADWLASLGTESLALLALPALVAWRRFGATVWLAAAIMLANVAAVALHGSRSDIFLWHRYYIPSYLMAAMLAGMGWSVLARRLPRPASWLMVLAASVLMASRWSDFDRSHYRIAEDFAEAVLESVPPGAHLAASDDNVLFVLIYLHLVEGRRPDLDLILQGVGDADLPDLRFDPDDDPLFFTHHPNWHHPALDVVPMGSVYRVWRRDRPWPAPMFPRERADGTARLDGEDDPRVPRDYLTENLIGHFHYTRGFAYETRDWPRAAREFREAADAAWRNDVLFYNLGLIYARNGLWEEAEAAFARSVRINPRHIASASAPRASDKLAATRSERARLAPLEAAAARSARAVRGSAAWHREMAAELEAAGEALRARGHILLSLEADAGQSWSPADAPLGTERRAG